MGGQFILRIEDTDIERSTQASVQAILEAMDWLGLNYNEGPYYQTKRFDRYLKVAQQLISEGKAYRCDCSKERLEKCREEQIAKKQKPRYDGHCRDRHLPAAGSYVIRFLNPSDGSVEFDDLVRGKVVFQNTELDDLVIVRSDGAPTYNFTVVVDDLDMTISHVIRGDDHINNTPRQINILRALGAVPPFYAHLPMILGNDGKRLSKRHGAVSVMQYREDGFLPAALLNYLVRLGWSHGDQEIFSISELIEYFDIQNLNKAPAALSQEKLLWLNQYYMKTSDKELVAKELLWHMEKLGISIHTGPALTEIVQIQCERTKTLKEMAERSRYFYEDADLTQDILENIPASLEDALTMLLNQLQTLPLWNKEAIHDVLTKVAETHTLKLGKLAQPVRAALTFGTVSPPIDITMVLIGQKRVIQRLTKAIALLQEKGKNNNT
jgi:glutamyl-tRNA synthetase